MSGVNRVEIEARRQADSTWESLAVEERSGSYSALLDDLQLAAGTYEVRARVLDNAGNEKTVTTLEDGTPLRVSLPVRAVSELADGEPSRVKVKSARGGRPKYRKVLIARPISSFGKTVAIEGKLTDQAGNPRANAPVEVFERVDAPVETGRTSLRCRRLQLGCSSFAPCPDPHARSVSLSPGDP